MGIYQIDCEHRDGDQIFSYWRGEKMLHFNVTLLERMRQQMPNEFRRITLDLDEAQYDLCMKHRGIEEDKVAALKPSNLREPGMACLLGPDEFTIVDGHHRLVRRYRGGVRVMDFWVMPEEIWRHALVPYGPEEEAEIAKFVPERVDNPEKITTGVTVHDD